jgi:hypothetical protein
MPGIKFENEDVVDLCAVEDQAVDAEEKGKVE